MSSAASRAAYAADWRDFVAFCGRRGFHALPASPQTLALYIHAQDAAGRRLSTIRRRLAAITAQHRAAGLPTPVDDDLVPAALAAVAQTQALEPDTASAPHPADARRPLFPADLRRMVQQLPTGITGVRDRALLLLGYATALRRSDLVALDVASVDVQEDRLLLEQPLPPQQPTRRLIVPRADDPLLCAVQATSDWLAVLCAVDQQHGPLFRRISAQGNVGRERLSDRSVALVTKRAAAAAGLDPAQYAAQSLRAGARLAQQIGAWPPASSPSIPAAAADEDTNGRH